jgi:hypothetical protein
MRNFRPEWANQSLRNFLLNILLNLRSAPYRLQVTAPIRGEMSTAPLFRATDPSFYNA